MGKTPLALNEYVSFNDVDLNIVLAPSSFVADWLLAPAEWGLGFLRSGMWTDSPLPFDWESGVYSIAHETLRGSKRARDGILELFKKRRCMLTFDETTGIKNPQSLLAKYCVGELSKYAVRVRELDGTPLIQNALDYYSKLRLLGELNGVNPYAFRNRFCVMGGFMGKQIKGIRNEEELGKLLDSCSFRALKKDWRKDMPEKLTVPIYLQMTDNQRKHYQTMMDEFYALVGDDEIDANIVLTQRMKLQQISSCMLMKDGRAYWINEPKDNPKLKAALDVLETGQGKMIVPYFFDPSGAMLFEQFTKAGLNPAWIKSQSRGGSPTGTLEAKAKFNNDPSCRVIIGQIDQLARGHTLLGQKGKDRCFRTFFYETSLSLMHVSQVSDRNHRGDQDETCLLYWPIASPIDQLNVDILTRKKSQADGMDALVAEIRKQKFRA